LSWATNISMTASDSNERSEIRKKLTFADRSAAFCWNLSRLLKLASVESLRFISEMAERLESNNFDPENDHYQKVVINPHQLDVLIADIDRLFLWCDSYVAETSKVFRNDGYNEEDVRQGIAKSADYTPDQFDSDLSCAPDFLFCVLKSMQDVLKYAKDNDLSITYENLVEC
jgi:hypothetical protein